MDTKMSKKEIDFALSRRSRFKSSKEFTIHVCGVPFTLDRKLVSTKSAKLCRFLKDNAQHDISHLVKDIPADSETMELVGRFCYGLEINLSTENVFKVSILSHYLEMTEEHCPDNLLQKSVIFIEQNIIPSWSKCVNALKSMEHTLNQAASMGLVSFCVGSLIDKALKDPSRLGEPIISRVNNDGDDDSDHDMPINRPNARRKLLSLSCESEELTTLSLKLYEHIIHEMIMQKVPLDYISASICQYARKWLYSNIPESDNIVKYRQKVIEAVERLLPHKTGLVPCSLLCQLLHTSVALNAKKECKEGLELRIGMQLDEATAEDLLIPTQGYSEDQKYDIECVRRILKHFYRNFHNNDISRLITVAELIDEYLIQIAGDKDLKLQSFISLARVSVTISAGTPRVSDGLYKAIDIYLGEHRYLTDSERELVCKVLDCNKMSPEACQHAALNDRLPLRVVMQVLFVSQLQLRDTIVSEVKCPQDRLLKLEGGNRETRVGGSSEEEVKTEIEMMGSKVLELERECCVIRKEMQTGLIKNKKEKSSMWKELKRKFGCSTRMQECHSHEKRMKKHPRLLEG